MSSQQPSGYGTQEQFGQTPQTESQGWGSQIGGFQGGMQGGTQGTTGGQMGQPGGQGFGAGIQQPGIGQQGQFQQPQQMGQTGTQGMQGMQQGGALDVTLDQALTGEMRAALDAFVHSTEVCEWCAERCIDHGPEMAECVRLCRDVADLASLNAQLIARDSVFGPEAAEVFVAAADACAQECSRHPQSHCQECADVLWRAVQTVQSMLASLQGGGQQGVQQQGQQGTAIQQGTGGGIQSTQQQPTAQYGQGF